VSSTARPPRITRRHLLEAAIVGLPALTFVRPVRAFAAEQSSHKPPYVALERFIQPGFDEFPEEKTSLAVELALHEALQSGELPGSHPITGVSPHPKSLRVIAADVHEAVFDAADSDVAGGWTRWCQSLGQVRRAEFHRLPGDMVRFGLSSELDGVLFHRTGFWKQHWADGKLVEFEPLEEHIVSARSPLFHDVTASAFSGVASFEKQLAKGIPYWRSRLDPACGIDVYGGNGIAVGDIDGDGEDEVYVCQPGGLPNRLYKFADDGRLQDVTDVWNVGLLDDTSSALFIDVRNIGRQDLVVLRSSGPVLFLNDGSKFRLRTDAFHFATAPAGGFTGMATADFDRDGKLDLYLCCYVYFHSEAQYTYATPYHDARNGPPNFLFRNRVNADGTGVFVDCTAETGINENNDRFSFAPAWCDFNGDGWPDLFVANDFGRKNLYVNHEGRFRDMAVSAGVEDIGPGMSASWFDYDNDGKPDLYVANMWTATGQRVVGTKDFEPAKAPGAREAYQAHTMGNSLYRNNGDGTFENVSRPEAVQFGRWAWASGGHDFDNDGTPEVFVTCGMLTNESPADLGSFFWRQVVARSPVTAQPSSAYENGWDAINQFLRETYSWNGNEPNVLHVRRGNRYYDFSGVSGLDFAQDGRAFAVLDFDGDGRPDILLKSRLGPQIRILQNNCAGEHHSIAFELVGTKSNRDAIGARIEVDGRTKWMEAGSGFLSQHSKRILFGLGSASTAKRVSILWPSGDKQELRGLQPGSTYRITEGSPRYDSRPFRSAAALPSLPVKVDNTLALQDTWFLEPIPLPEPQTGPKLLTLTDADFERNPSRREQYAIFRRYLFDWRTGLTCPLSLLLNRDGHAVKIYEKTPSDEQVRMDLGLLSTGKTPRLPFPGFYVGHPGRDFFKWGVAYMWAGYPEQALPYLEKVLTRSPGNVRVHVVVGQIQLDANRLAAAEAAFRKALELDQTNAEALNGLGLALAKQGHVPEGQERFKRAIAIKRDYSDAINNLGVSYAQQGKLDDAISAFDYGIRVAPNEDILYLNLGRLYVQSGKMDRARQVMQELLDRQPDNPTARRALADLSGR
jgi:Tfp pilus assembly protein PilF